MLIKDSDFDLVEVVLNIKDRNLWTERNHLNEFWMKFENLAEF